MYKVKFFIENIATLWGVIMNSHHRIIDGVYHVHSSSVHVCVGGLGFTLHSCQNEIEICDRVVQFLYISIN
jgi:hypothetical protein